MPYFIYRVSGLPIRRMEKLEQHDAYRDASARTRQLRAGLAKGSNHTVRMIFAETGLHAEDLLNQVREPDPDPGE